MQIKEDSIMSNSIETVRPMLINAERVKAGHAERINDSSILPKNNNNNYPTVTTKQGGDGHHMTSWSLSKGRPVPSIENYIVNIDGSVKGDSSKVQPKKKLTSGKATPVIGASNAKLIAKAKK